MSRTYQVSEYQTHNTRDDFMVLVGLDNKIYHFLDWDHPAGWSTIAPYAGQLVDREVPFKRIHTEDHLEELQQFFVGYLALDECYVKFDNQVSLSVNKCKILRGETPPTGVVPDEAYYIGTAIIILILFFF